MLGRSGSRRVSPCNIQSKPVGSPKSGILKYSAIIDHIPNKGPYWNTHPNKEEEGKGQNRGPYFKPMKQAAVLLHLLKQRFVPGYLCEGPRAFEVPDSKCNSTIGFQLGPDVGVDKYYCYSICFESVGASMNTNSIALHS